MVFTSFQYAGFLLVVLAAYWSLPTRARPALLLVASYAFYATWGPELLLLLGLSTIVTWAVGRSLPGAPRSRQRLLTTVAALTSIGVLALFKLLEAIDDHAPTDGSGGLRWVVPVGLSFFTFQAISYVIDIYRGDLEPRDSLVDVALYIAFFPHLLAGPIVRAGKLIPAFHAVDRRPDPVRSAEGAELILFGVFKKVVLADPIIGHVGVLAAEPGSLATVNGLVALVGGVVAAYFDITAYVDIARGSAKLLGIDMQRNSLSPLLRSTGYADFWRRWQLTVMMWFRDYVYRPLRGDGRSARRETLALFGSFAALGIWHGISPGWVIWGLVSGVIIVVERTRQTRSSARRRARVLAARQAGRRPPRPKRTPRWVQLGTTYLLVALTLPLIGARSLADVPRLYGIFVHPRGGATDWDLVILAALAVGGLFALDGRERRREERAGHPDPLTAARVAAFALAVTAIVIFSGADPEPFLYFQY